MKSLFALGALVVVTCTAQAQSSQINASSGGQVSVNAPTRALSAVNSAPAAVDSKQFLTAVDSASQAFYGVNLAGLHPFKKAANVGFCVCVGASSQVTNWSTDAAFGLNTTIMSLDPSLPGIVAGVLVRPTHRFEVSAFVGIAAGTW